MNKAILGVLIAVVAIGAIALTNSSDTTGSLLAVPEVIASSGNFTYETFSDARYNELRGNEAFAVFFHSKSCGTCAKMNQQIIDEVSTFTNGTILKAEFSEASAAMLKELGVAKYHTTVVFNADGTFKTLKGAMPEDVRGALGGSQAATRSAVEKVVNIIVPTVHAQNADFTYQDFDTATYNNLRGNEEFAVFFHSKTCGTCAKKNAQIIDEVSQFTDGTILKAEFSEADAAMLKELGVAKYDTFVTFDAAGNPTTVKGAQVADVRNAI
jgi:thiol-disulfide isomerase/thioredoxin